VLLTFLFSASQDIATDALAVNLLEPTERGIGNAIQSSGNILGAVIGGGVMLILLDKIGWQYSLIAMSFMLILNLIPILLHQEDIVIKPKQSNLFNSYIQSFVHFLKRPNILPWLFVIPLYMMGDSVTSVLIRPLLVDRGLKLSEIGWILGIVSYSARIVGALTAGIMIMRIGRKKSLILFGFISAISTLLYIIPANGVNSLFILYTVCILVNTIQSMAYTALLSAMMDKCTKSGAATDYTIQVSIMFLGGIGATVTSGILAKATSYTFVFVASTAISLLSVYLIYKIYKHTAI
jgi:predicted MFS family arabinose efflux permease